MAAIMNPFMIPLWDSGGRIGFDDGRARHSEPDLQSRSRNIGGVVA